MKKRLFLSSAIMTAVLAGALTTGTFAWYQASNSGSLAQNTATTSALSTKSVTVDLAAGAKLNMVPSSTSTELIITNRSGRSYYFAGNNLRELSQEQAPHANRVVALTYNVSIVGADENAISDVDTLATLAGTYIIKATASGQAKLSLVNTASASDYGTDGDSDKAYDAGEEATGVLGVALQQATDIMKIEIDAAGNVKYYVPTFDSTWAWNSGTTWALANLDEGVSSATFYVGLEVDDLTNADDLGATGTITPAMVATTGVGFH